jgi:hypothetical protein
MNREAQVNDIILETIAPRYDVRATYNALAVAKAEFSAEMLTLSVKTNCSIQRSRELLDRLTTKGGRYLI